MADAQPEKIKKFQKALDAEGFLASSDPSVAGSGKSPDISGKPNPATDRAIKEVIVYAQETTLYQKNFGPPTGIYDPNTQRVFDAMVKNKDQMMLPALASAFREAAAEGWLGQIYTPPTPEEAQTIRSEVVEKLQKEFPKELDRLKKLDSFGDKSNLDVAPSGRHAEAMPRTQFVADAPPEIAVAVTAAAKAGHEQQTPRVRKAPGISA